MTPTHLNRLTTRDGIKGEFQECFGSYQPEINTIPCSKEEGPMLEIRQYILKRHYTIEVFEYEEV